MTVLTQEWLKKLMDYDPVTGVFTYRVKDGGVAGAVGKSRRTISVWNVRYYDYRLAWLWVYGKWPKQIDHADGNPLNCALSNLREATQTQNMANRRATGKVGVKGVQLHPSGRYRVMRGRRGGSHHIGYFDTLEEAKLASAKVGEALYGGYSVERRLK